MHGAHAFLAALATVLGVAGATTILFQRLGQPVVLGYLIAGLIIGPHVPIPLVADPEIVETLSELGVILLMFSVGLELRIRTLLRMAPTAGVTAVVQCSLMVWLGFLTGRLFGWTSIESLFAGGAIAISSTTIIAKAFDDQKIRGQLRETVVGILVVEDLIAILLIAVLTAIAKGSGLSAGSLASTVGRLAAFLIGLLVVGILTVPRAIRAIVRLDRPETTVIASVAICFGVALLAQYFGYSVALGAFIAGSLVAESGEEKKIEHLIQPVRDVFAAIFFVSVGMMIEPAQIARHAPAIAVLTAVVVVGKIVSVTLGAFLTGGGVRTVGAGGHEPGADRRVLVHHRRRRRRAGRHARISVPGRGDRVSGDHAADPLDDPRGDAGGRLRRSQAAPAAADVRRSLRQLDRTIAATPTRPHHRGGGGPTPGVVGDDRRRRGRRHRDRRIAVRETRVAVAGTVASPEARGRAHRRAAHRAGAVAAFSDRHRARGTAPGRRAGCDRVSSRRFCEVWTWRLRLAARWRSRCRWRPCWWSVAPILAVTQPFLRGIEIAVPLLALAALLGIAFWRSATNLQGHVRAGVQVIVEALGKRLQDETATAPGTPEAPPDFDRLLPGLGAPLPVRLEKNSPAVGRTLTELNLRAITGATVLAIVRQGQGLVPTPDDALEVGDVLALAGTHDALDSARQILGVEAAAPDGADAIP